MVIVFPMQFTVRPLQGAPSLDGAFRISLSPRAFDELQLKAGDLCAIHHGEDFIGIGVAWRSKDIQLSKSIVQVSDTLKDTFGLKIGDSVSIRKNEDPVVKANVIYVKDVTPNATPIANDDIVRWQWLSGVSLWKAALVTISSFYEASTRSGERRIFRVVGASSTSDNQKARYEWDFTTKISISESDSSDARLSVQPKPLTVSLQGIGGLPAQLERIRKRVQYLNNAEDTAMPNYYRPGGGILLYGPTGTGKTLVLEKLAVGPWRTVARIDGSQTAKAVHVVFAEALSQQPSLIIMDNLETYGGSADREVPSSLNLASTLAVKLKNLVGSKVLVIGAATRLDDVHKCLRTSATFRHEIEVPIPDSKARAEILKVIMRRSPSEPDTLLDVVSETLHGFVGSDLEQLVMTAAEHARDRLIRARRLIHGLKESSSGFNDGHPDGYGNVGAGMDGQGVTSNNEKPVVKVVVEREDFEAARLLVRPTAMKEIFLETPKVRWSDIGGQQEVKKSLQTTVEGRFKHPDRIQRLGYDNEKGILLYGPPGCSKTLTAKALATEAGLNFIAVKGAELISMYVGESERAVREVFRKARNASPSIVFFDEIDAIASSREGPNHTSGLNILTTLLNEMDGIEEMKQVLVVAATNKPEILDKALMRPGRLDLLQYVGLPDQEARMEILKNKLSKMDVAANVNIWVLAIHTDGCSGAELIRICNFAGKLAYEECVDTGREIQIHARHFETAITKTPKQITRDMLERYQRFAYNTAVI